MSKVRLGDIAEVITKGTTPTSLGYEFKESGINFIKIESITESGCFISDKFAHISSECHYALKRSQLKKNDVLFSIAGAIGRVGIVDDSILPANTNQALAIIRIPDGVIDYNYLFYYLHSNTISQQYNRKKQGVAQINLSLSDISNFEIELPSINEQRRIANNLDKVITLILSDKKRLAKLDELVKSQFVEMFGDISYSNKFQYKKVQEFTGVVSGGTPNRDNNDYWENGKIPWVKTTELKHAVIEKTEEYITDKGLAESSAKIVPENTIVIAMYGQGKTRGMTGLLKIKASTNQACACVLPSDNVNHIYLWKFFELSYDNLRDLAKGGNQPNLNGNMIKNYPVLFPPRSLQNQFADFVTKVEKQKVTVQKSIDKLETLKKSLMQEYFG